MVKTSSGRGRCTKTVAATQWNAEEDPHDEPDSEVNEAERTGDKLRGRRDRPEGESDQSRFEKDRIIVSAVLEDATVGVASRRFSPHVSMMQTADAGQGDDLRMR